MDSTQLGGGGGQWIGDNLIEVRVKLMNEMVQFKGREKEKEVVVYGVTMWKSKKRPMKENLFLLRHVFSICGDAGHWWLAVFANLNSSPEIWILDSIPADSAERSRRAGILWDMLQRH